MSNKLTGLFKRKENPDIDQSFYRKEKLKKRIKFKSRLSDAILVFLVVSSVIALTQSFKKQDIQENEMLKQFTREFILDYYAYPQTDETKQSVSRFTIVQVPIYQENVKKVEVSEMLINDIKSEKKDDILWRDVNAIIKLTITKEGETKEEEFVEEQTITRTFTILDEPSTRTLGVLEITPIKEVVFGNTALSNYVLQPKITTEYLTEDEKKTADNRVQMFLNLYNESWDKAADLMLDSSTLKRKSDDVTIQYDGLLTTTKSKDNKIWYIQAKVLIINPSFTESKKIEFHLNIDTGRVEKMEVY